MPSSTMPATCECPDCAQPPFMMVVFRDQSTAWFCLSHCRDAAQSQG